MTSRPDPVRDLREARTSVSQLLPDAVVSLTTGRVVISAEGVTGSWFPGTGLPVLATTADGRLLECISVAEDTATAFGDVIGQVVTWRRDNRRP